MIRVLAPLAAVALVLAPGCSGDDDGPPAAASSTTPATATSVTAPTTGVPTTAGPPTTASPLVPIDGCPAPGALAPPDPDRPRYVGEVTIDVVAGTVDGRVRVRFTPDLATSELVFRLWPNAPRPAAAGTTMAVTSVRDARTGAALPMATPDPTTLVIAVGELRPGVATEVDVEFRLDVGGAVSDRVSRQGDSLRLGTYLPLLAWEPGVGWAREPATSLFAEAATSTAADYELAIRVPAGYDVLATGSPGADGVWRATAVRDVAASVGRFDQVSATEHLPEPVTVTVGVDAAVAEDPAAYLERVQGALRDFAGRYGAYPWPTFTLAVTPGLDGGIEFPTHVMQGPGTIGRTTPHEVAHMWFYALVGNDQGRDPWLDEGLASYAEFVHEGAVEQAAARDVPADARGRGAEPMTYWEDHRASYYRGVYLQPAVALASLGPVEQIDCALRHYVAAAAFTVATPADLFESLVAVFPDAAERLAAAGLHP